jgi:hypothetical protein
MINYGTPLTTNLDDRDITFYTYKKWSKIDDLPDISNSLLIIDGAHNLSNLEENVIFALKSARKVLLLAENSINGLEDFLVNIFHKKFREVF